MEVPRSKTVYACIRSSGWMRIETKINGGPRVAGLTNLHPVFGLDED